MQFYLASCTLNLGISCSVLKSLQFFIFMTHLCIVSALFGSRHWRGWKKEKQRENVKAIRSWVILKQVVLIEYKQMRAGLCDAAWHRHWIAVSTAHIAAAAPIGRACIQIPPWSRFQLWKKIFSRLTLFRPSLYSLFNRVFTATASVSTHLSIYSSLTYIIRQRTCICSHSLPGSALSTRLNLTWHILHIPHALTFI